MAEASEKIYNNKFYQDQAKYSYAIAQKIVPIVIDVIHPKTMIDVGCGVGAFVKVFQELGVDAYGIDGDFLDRSQLMIDEKKFFVGNLERRINLDTKLDLAMSLEVAEHLMPNRAMSFVEDLTKMSDVVLFSAAIPEQGGTNHINEQWQSHWKHFFEQFGFLAIDYLRAKTWYNQEIPFIYRQNSLIYVNSSELDRFPKLAEFYRKYRDVQIIDKVHPETYLWKIWNLQNKRFEG